jgi:hypothetical protein
LCLFIGDWLVSHFIDGLFKGLKRVKGLLFGELHKEERDR